MVAGSKNLESSILKQVQHDAMWCFLNNIRQSFQTRILNLVFNLLRGFYGERRTDDGQRGFSSAFSGFSVFKHTAAAPENGEPTTDNYFFCLQLTTWNLELIFPEDDGLLTYNDCQLASYRIRTTGTKAREKAFGTTMNYNS